MCSTDVWMGRHISSVQQWVSPSSWGKTRQRGEIENVKVCVAAEEECWRYNTKSIKDNFRPQTLEIQALNHEVIHSDWSRSVVITWESYMWMTRRTVKRFKAEFNGSKGMCLEIISEGANGNLKAFYQHLAAVQWNSCSEQWNLDQERHHQRNREMEFTLYSHSRNSKGLALWTRSNRKSTNEACGW